MISVIVILVFGILLILLGLKNKEQEKKLNKQEIAIETISKLWKTRQTEIQIEQLVKLWRSDEEKRQEQNNKNITFTKPIINAFYNLHIVDQVDEVSEEIIVDLLKLLDEKGDIPSVIRRDRDPNSELPDESFKMLANIPLYEHTIRVAEETIKATKSTPLTMNKAIIAALAHDIGKIFASSDEYSKFDHPALSAAYLERNLPSLNKSNFRNEIIAAVRGHHKSDVFSMLTDILKKADSKARQIELEMCRKQMSVKVEQTEEPQQEEQPVQKPILKLIKSDEIKEELTPEEKEYQLKKREEFKDTVKETVNRLDANQWIDNVNDEEVLKRIADVINKLDDYGRFQAVSMKDGLVYVRPEFVFDIIKEYLPEDKQIDSLSEHERRLILITFSNYFIDKGYINTKYMMKNYFSAPFIITIEGGRELTGFYMTFNIEAFAKFGTLTEFEIRKTDYVKNIVKITRKYTK
jgi:hypothetical protein